MSSTGSMKYSERKLNQAVSCFALVIPKTAHASDPTFLMFGFLVLVIFCALLFYVFTKLLLGKLKNENLKRLMKILPLTLFFSPSFSGGFGYIWPSSFVLVAGSTDEKLASVLSVIIFTVIIYFLFMLRDKYR